MTVQRNLLELKICTRAQYSSAQPAHEITKLQANAIQNSSLKNSKQ